MFYDAMWQSVESTMRNPVTRLAGQPIWFWIGPIQNPVGSTPLPKEPRLRSYPETRLLSSAYPA